SPPVKPWGFHQGLEVIPPPQVVFLQPVISNSNATPPKSPQDKRRRSEKYLPILKSYPKIAPHPGDGSSENSGSSSSGVSSVSSAREGRVSVLRHRRHSRDKRQSRPIWSASPALSSLPPTPSSQSSPREESSTLTGSLSTKMEDTPLSGQPAQTKVSQESALSLQSPRMPFPPPESETASLPSQACPTPDPSMSESEGEGSHCSLSDNRNKRKRFCNTYNILHKSGLLGITLRTKDLIRQNRKTQLELERLKEQTCLFVQAVNSGDPQVWTKLQLAMLQANPTAEENGEKVTQKRGLEDEDE
ncbi:CIPC protein, partial [Amia calva]|nr:CIPC protein [Amia calva]